MLYNCIKYIFYILKQVKKGKKRKKEMSKGKKEISDEMIKLDYKNRMDKFRPDKIIILKRRMRIYWYHKENS